MFEQKAKVPNYEPDEVAFNKEELRDMGATGPAQTKEFEYHIRNLEENIFKTMDIYTRLEAIMDRLRGSMPRENESEIATPSCTIEFLRTGTSIQGERLDRLSNLVTELESYV